MSVRDQILLEATRQFAARGFDGASLKTISEAVGVRKASLLYHFSSKDALRRAVLEQMLSTWRERVPSLLMAAASGSDQFEAVTEELIGFFVADPDRARILLRETLDRPDEMRELLTVHVTPWVGTVCDQIKRGQQAGRVHADLDPEAYVTQVINLVISSMATFSCLAALLRKEDADETGGPMKRHIDELRRVARISLFVPRPARPSRGAPEEDEPKE